METKNEYGFKAFESENTPALKNMVNSWLERSADIEIVSTNLSVNKLTALQTVFFKKKA